jgi:hypothetical protein
VAGVVLLVLVPAVPLLVDPVVALVPVLPVVLPVAPLLLVVPPLVVPVLLVLVVPLVLSDAVWVTPLANLVVALADVMLPLASSVYCAVPEPAPHALSNTDTPVKVVSDNARTAVTSNDTLNIKNISYVNVQISSKRSNANACVRALLYEKSSN